MHTLLSTGVFGTWTVTSLRDSLLAELDKDKSSSTLKMYFYAVTNRGWTEIRKSVTRWMQIRRDRTVVIYVGTDHAITEPSALEMMQADQVNVRVMRKYQGVFHPKVVWLQGANKNIVWVGSNNLTKDGLLHNIEFAVLVRSASIPAELRKWIEAVDLGSVALTNDLLQSYRAERQEFEAKRARSKSMTFTWSRKQEPAFKKTPRVVLGDLIIEIMPKETGDEGKQIQLPIEAAKTFFGVSKVGTKKTIRLKPKDGQEYRDLSMTVFRNNTVRLSMSDLEYSDRPCVVVFHPTARGAFRFEIVAQNISPNRYKSLIARCTNRTRRGSRRWVIASGHKK